MRSKRSGDDRRTLCFLKISEGCNKRCTYCIIPSLRGPYRSVPMEQLLAEAKELADQGVKELILVAQETTLYGVDLYGEKTLPKLLHELAQIDGIEWIRIQYCYPEEIAEELIRGDQDGAKKSVITWIFRSSTRAMPFSSGWDAARIRRSFGSGSRICGKRFQILHSARP
ncbi:MAG: radical SAM protein [Clostridium fessum]